MQVSLIDIGTSKGNQIVLDTIEAPRKGWEDKFKNSSELLIDDTLDAKDWDEL